MPEDTSTMTEALVYPRLQKKNQKYSRVQKKGQVTIPLELRTKLGIEEGDMVTFTETSDGILISTGLVLPTGNRTEPKE
jgi:AbrB family looped-hinge helix DNA binding protein